jgi:hypothetical protein
MSHVGVGARQAAYFAGRRITLWAYAPVVAATVLRFASGPTANLSYLLIAAYALLGRAHAIRALALSWLFTMLSSGLAPAASAGAVGRYAVLFSAAASVFLHSDVLSATPRVRHFTFATVLLGFFLIGHSFLFSPLVDVSLLKALSWTLAMATIIAAWSGLSPSERLQVESEIYRGLVLILIVSLPLTVLPLGYMRNGSGFQGILNHPQAFGPTMALLGAWTAARMFGERKPGWFLVGLAGACLAVILMSEARTAGLAMIGGVALSIIVAPSFAGRPIRQMVPGLRSSRIWVVLGMVLAAGIVLAPQIAGTFQHYITKSGRSSGTTFSEIYDRSRGRLIDAMLQNVSEQPLTGIGFGIASEPWTMEVSRDPVLGLPIGASIEKGVVPLMVVEEVGVIGAALVAFWLLRLLRSAARSGVAPFAVCLTALLINMGEATLFSPGGLGLLLLILLGWAYAGGLPDRGRGLRRG